MRRHVRSEEDESAAAALERAAGQVRWGGGERSVRARACVWAAREDTIRSRHPVLGIYGQKGEFTRQRGKRQAARAIRRW